MARVYPKVFWPVVLSALLVGCASFGGNLPEDGVEYLRTHQTVLDLDATGSAVGADLLESAEVYLLGETHGVAANEATDFALLIYLYATGGVRTYLAEVGFSAGRLYDTYVQTGDRRYLDQVFSSLQGTTAWNVERYEFWKRVAEFNAAKPAGDRIRVIGLDVEHQYAVGIVAIYSLIPADKPEPLPIRAEIEEIRSIVAENAWSAERCRVAAKALDEGLTTNPAPYAEYFGDRLPELLRTIDSLLDGFAYRYGRGAEAENARDESMYERFLDLAPEYPGPYYGKLGAEHTYQLPYRGLLRFGARLDLPESPFSDRVISILLAYDDGARLARSRDGSWGSVPFESDRRLLRPVVAAAAPGDGTVLFRLTAPGSPMTERRYLLEAPTGGGVTTDYVQYVVLERDARASTIFEVR